jgi:non-canonical (house-cleaning) NTP pyrophosphatase
MKIEINNRRKIFAIQEEFSTNFPNLKIEFYAKPSKSGGAPSPKLVRHSSKTLKECRSISEEGTIEILPSMNISELKDSFRNTYGLSVEIFQKAENESDAKPVGDSQTIKEINNNIPHG